MKYASPLLNTLPCHYREFNLASCHWREFHGVNPSEMRFAVTSSISRGKKVGGLRFRYTWDIIEAAEKGLLPDKIMLNIHPQRWTDRPLPWVKELVWQNVKNVIKRYMIKLRD